MNSNFSTKRFVTDKMIHDYLQNKLDIAAIVMIQKIMLSDSGFKMRLGNVQR
jgi:hypothetical protein